MGSAGPGGRGDWGPLDRDNAPPGLVCWRRLGELRKFRYSLLDFNLFACR